MPKRLTAALASLLMLASVLAGVPLASPAAAHPQTKQRCAYDPFAGNQCWKVNVAHTHTCPAGTTGTYPNCERIKRDTRTSEQAAEDERKREQEQAENKQDGGQDQGGSTGSDNTGDDSSTDSDSTGDGSGTRGTRSNRPPQTNTEEGSGQSELGAWLSGAWSGLKRGVSWFVEGQGKVAESQKETIDAEREAMTEAAKKVMAGLEQVLKDLSESERQRINADLAATRSLMQSWQALPPDAQIIISGGACGLAGAPIGGPAGAAGFGAGCAYLGHQFGKAELPKLIPPGWEPPEETTLAPADDSGDGHPGGTDSTDSTDGQDSGTGSGTGTTESDNEQPLSDAEARKLLDQIERDWRARKINANEANEAHNRIRCRQGHWSCRR